MRHAIAVLTLALAFLPATSLAETLRVKSKAAVRYGPSYVTRVVGSVRGGSIVESSKRDGEWYKITLPDGETGYVHASAVEIIAATSAAPVPPPAETSPAPLAPPAPPPAPPPARPAPPAPAPSADATPPPALPPAAPGAPVTTPPQVAPPERPAPKANRFKVMLDGVYGQSLDFAETRSIEEFVESGSAAVDYANDAAPGFGAAIQVMLIPHLGVRAAFTYAKRDGDAHYEASFPHPLYFERHRTVSGDISALSYDETSGHLDVVLSTEAGPLDLAVFAGGSVVKVEAELLDSFTKTEAYPFDQTIVTGVSRAAVSDTPFGFNAGAGVDWRFADHVGLGVQFFYSQAKAKLERPGGGLEIDAGGAHVTGGIRFMF